MTDTEHTDTAEKLTDAFHAVFDVKDTLTPGSPGFVAAYDAIARIESLMADLGIEAPERYDARGADRLAKAFVGHAHTHRNTRGDR